MNNLRLVILLVFLSLEFYNLSFAQKITLNQLGYPPISSKLAVVNGSNQSKFYITSEDGKEILFTGNLSTSDYWNASDETVQVADFSDFNALGKYKINIPGVVSSTFEIKQEPYLELTKGALKALYYNRASTAIDAAYAGKFARAAGHPDNQVYIHSSAASIGRPEGTIVSAPKGWYDAGDFNKYVVNSGISTYQVLALYEHFPDFSESLNTNIPESSNNIPDILDEALWNLEWMLNMQDPTDGGVYHKLTSKNFTGSIMPARDNTTRYMVGKGTAATLDFAAVMAQASRIFKNIPGKSALANQMLSAAEYAYEWAADNTYKTFNNPNDISTGGYGDNNFSDEFYWANAELFITTGDSLYYKSKNLSQPSLSEPQWQQVASLGAISLLNHPNVLNSTDLDNLKGVYQNYGESIYNRYLESPYATSMTSGNFYWASNSVALNQAFILIHAFKNSSDLNFLKAAQSNLDYVLGRNPLEYCFVTGFGKKSPQSPHHRISEADGIAEPVPGFLVGGANPGAQDGCPYESNLPALSYLDSDCSYASNEIAINWNSSLIYVAGAMSAIEYKRAGSNGYENYFTSQPSSQTVCSEGAEITLSTTLVKTASATLQWQVSADDGNSYSDLSNDGTYSGSTTKDLTINSVNASFSGNLYQLVITENGTKTSSVSAELTVFTEPLIITENACGAGNSLAMTDRNINNYAWFNGEDSNEILYRGDSISPNITKETTLYGGIEESNKLTLIQKNDFWVFYKGDQNPGSTWFKSDFNDSRWKSYDELPVEAGGSQKGENIAANKEISVSSTSTGTANSLIDGNLNSFWRSNSSQEEWAFVDLEETKEFNRLDLYIGASKPTSIRIEISDNKFAWTTVHESTQLLSGLNTYFFEISNARYVRVKFLSNGNRSTTITELEVYEPVENPFLGKIANNYSTVYLRKDFEIGNPNDLDYLSMNFEYQDGAVIWINGKKIISRNAPTNLSNTSLATNTLVEQVKEYYIINEPDTILHQGINTIAVQMLNSELSDPTIYFGLELSTGFYTFGSSCPRTPVTINIDTCEAFPNANKFTTCEEDPNFIFFTKETVLDLDYLWDFGKDASPATAEGIGPIEVSYSSPGEKKITLTVDNNTTENQVYIYTNEECYLSADDGELDLTEASISVYPNPFTSGTQLELIDNFFKKGEVTVIDINGRILEEKTIYNGSPLYLGENLQKGIYFIKIETPKKDFSMKLIKE